MASAEIAGLDHALLTVPALAEAVARFTLLLRAEPVAQGEGWARFPLANTALLLAEAPGPAALSGLGFGCADPASAARLLERRGLPGAPQAWPGGEAHALSPEAARGLRLALLPARAPEGGAMRLDHLVVQSADPERTIALFAGRLGLELRLDRSNPAWGTRLLFFRCGDAVLEVSHSLKEGISDKPDSAWGLTWGVADVAAEHARLEAAGLPVSPLRVGRKPGTRIFTLRENAGYVPMAFLGS